MKTLKSKIALMFMVGLAIFLSACQTQTSETTSQTVDAISHAHSIAVDINDSGKLYIATHEGLLVLKDLKLSKVGENSDDMMGFSIDKKNSLRFYSSGHPATGGNSGFQKTNDGGLTWVKVSDGIGGPVDFHSMAVSPINSNIVYGSYGKIQKSNDGGVTWNVLENSPAKITSLLADSENELTVYATTQQGIWISKDGGVNWESLSKDLASSAVIVLAQNPVNPQDMLSVSSALGLVGSNDGGATWSAIQNAPNTIFYYLAYSQSESQIVYGIDRNNEIYKSADAGKNWLKIYE